MAYFAKLNENNEVLEVLSLNDDVITVNGIQEEQLGINFLAELTNYSNWIQTFQDGSKRKNYAGIGGKYYPEEDVFVPKKPYDSWVLNRENYQWEPPIPMPSDQGVYYIWNEDSKNWQSEIFPL